jgi:hypothetical protein
LTVISNKEKMLKCPNGICDGLKNTALKVPFGQIDLHESGTIG